MKLNEFTVRINEFTVRRNEFSREKWIYSPFKSKWNEMKWNEMNLQSGETNLQSGGMNLQSIQSEMKWNEMNLQSGALQRHRTDQNQFTTHKKKIESNDSPGLRKIREEYLRNYKRVSWKDLGFGFWGLISSFPLLSVHRTENRTPGRWQIRVWLAELRPQKWKIRTRTTAYEPMKTGWLWNAPDCTKMDFIKLKYYQRYSWNAKMKRRY
jgi:hypothetical protein